MNNAKQNIMEMKEKQNFEVERRNEIEIELHFSQIYTSGTAKEMHYNERVKLKRGTEGSIRLSEALVPFLHKGLKLDSQMFLYYSPLRDAYVFCGNDGTMGSAYIPLEGIRDKLLIKCRKINKVRKPLRQGGTGDSRDGAVKQSKRMKERKICEIINKVTQWRKYYSGIPQEDGTILKFSLGEAADKVGIAKKTLDDYLLQLRFGKKYNFDFNLNKDEKVGILRSFVKQQKLQIHSAPRSGSV